MLQSKSLQQLLSKQKWIICRCHLEREREWESVLLLFLQSRRRVKVKVVEKKKVRTEGSSVNIHTFKNYWKIKIFSLYWKKKCYWSNQGVTISRCFIIYLDEVTRMMMNLMSYETPKVVTVHNPQIGLLRNCW